MVPLTVIVRCTGTGNHSECDLQVCAQAAESALSKARAALDAARACAEAREAAGPARSPLSAVSRPDLEDMLQKCQEAELQGKSTVAMLKMQLKEARRHVETEQVAGREVASELKV
jgi:hypothetical protein